VEVVNDYEIVMRRKVVCVDLAFYYSSASNVIIFSKQQWDGDGETGPEGSMDEYQGPTGHEQGH